MGGLKVFENAVAEERGAQWSVDKLQRLAAASAAAAVEALPAWQRRGTSLVGADGTGVVTKTPRLTLEGAPGHPKQVTLEEPVHLQKSRLSRSMLPDSAVSTRHGSVLLRTLTIPERSECHGGDLPPLQVPHEGSTSATPTLPRKFLANSRRSSAIRGSVMLPEDFGVQHFACVSADAYLRRHLLICAQ